MVRQSVLSTTLKPTSFKSLNAASSTRSDYSNAKTAVKHFRALRRKSEKISPKEETCSGLTEAIIGLSQLSRRGLPMRIQIARSVPVFKRVFSGFDETLTLTRNETSGF